MATQVYADREYLTLAALMGYRSVYVPGGMARYVRWSATQVTQSVSYLERVYSRRRLFRRFQDVAALRPATALQEVRWFLLRQCGCRGLSWSKRMGPYG